MVTIHQAGLGAPMKRVPVARMATVKPQGWVDAALGMGGARPAFTLLNKYKYSNKIQRLTD